MLVVTKICFQVAPLSVLRYGPTFEAAISVEAPWAAPPTVRKHNQIRCAAVGHAFQAFMHKEWVSPAVSFRILPKNEHWGAPEGLKIFWIRDGAPLPALFRVDKVRQGAKE
jgi:hypothetical protein